MIYNYIAILNNISDIPEDILDSVPNSQFLTSVSNHIGDSSLQLGIELGFDVPKLQSIQHQLKDKLVEQTREILRQWTETPSLNPTVRSLTKALIRLEKIQCLETVFYESYD